MARTGAASIRQTPTGRTIIGDPVGLITELLQEIPGYGPGATLRVDSAGEPFFDGTGNDELREIPAAHVEYENGELVIGEQVVDAEGNPVEPQEPAGDVEISDPSQDPGTPEIVAEAPAEPAPVDVPATPTTDAPPIEVSGDAEALIEEHTEPAPAPGKVQHRGSKSTK
jgi:hypothetical protein